MGLPKGKTNNPNGRPHKSAKSILFEALARAKNNHGGVHLIQHLVDEAYSDNALGAQIIRKILPDLSHLDVKEKRKVIIVCESEEEAKEKARDGEDEMLGGDVPLEQFISHEGTEGNEDDEDTNE